MKAGSTWPSIFLMTVILGTLEAMQQAEPPLMNTWRNRVLDAAERDPCSRHGLWLHHSQHQKIRARFDCVQAWVAFRDLTENEKVSCVNSDEPKCRPFGAQPHGCSHLMYRCTFICSVRVEQQRVNLDNPLGPLERVTVTELREKDIHSIAFTVLDPPGPLRNRRRRPNPPPNQA